MRVFRAVLRLENISLRLNSRFTLEEIDLEVRDGACVDVCPVECIIGGQPEDEWPWFYIDPDTCIDCGLCEEACPSGIPLRTLYKKVNSIMDDKFDFKTGLRQGQRSPLNNLDNFDL